MVRIRVWLVLSTILAVAAFLRFHDLESTPPGLYMDEAMSGVNAQNVAQTGRFQVFYPEAYGREGLYINILAVLFRWHLLPDNEPWSVRFPAACAGVLTVLGMFFLVGELFDGRRGLALFAAFLLATSYWHLNFSRLGFRAILAPFLLVWALYFLIKMLSDPARFRLWASAGGLCYGLGFYTYTAFRITPLLLLVLIPFFRRKSGFWKHSALFLAVALVVALPLGWHYLQNPADFTNRTAEVSITNTPRPVATTAWNTFRTAMMFFVEGDGNPRHNLPFAPQLYWPVAGFFLVGVVVALVSSDRKRYPRFAVALLLVWLALGALPAILSKEGVPHALRSILMVIPAMIFAALGGGACYRWLTRRLPRAGVAAMAGALAIFLSYTTFHQYFEVWAQSPDVSVAFGQTVVDSARAIEEMPESAEKYVIVHRGSKVDYGIPKAAVPLMYITHSFVPDEKAQKYIHHIHFLSPDEVGSIPPGTPRLAIFEVE